MITKNRKGPKVTLVNCSTGEYPHNQRKPSLEEANLEDLTSTFITFAHDIKTPQSQVRFKSSSIIHKENM